MSDSVSVYKCVITIYFPIVLTPTRGIDENSFVSRNSVEEVYNQVIADLIAAASKLPEENEVFATSGAATALLARVYLQKGDYARARDAASTVIESGLYELQPSYADVFNNDDNTSEDIFATQITSQDRFSAMTEYFSIPEYGGRDGDIEILEGHLNLYSRTMKGSTCSFSETEECAQGNGIISRHFMYHMNI